MLKIKDFILKTRIIQSPMAGCTDLAFRLLAREHGMEFAFLEMVSANALINQNRKSIDLMKSTETDRPLGAQLVGCDPDIMGDAAAIVESMGFDWLDLNLGCPVPKIVSPGGGSALLVEPEKSKRIFEKVIQNIKKIPVTIKMRKGFSDPSGEEAVRMAKIAEDSGMAAVTVHGRTRVQGYSGTADWEAIGKVKKAVRIPVFGNGDVTSGNDAKKLMEVSGCDGIMVGRGALGNPWLYRSIEAMLEGREDAKSPDLEQLKRTALRHVELEVETEGERMALLKSRRIVCWYFKHQPGVSEFRDKINRAQSVDEVKSLISRFGRAAAA